LVSAFFRLVCDFEVLTPMFLGGAGQNTPELRAPSVKGAMRFWYRAFDPEFKRREPLYFGSGGRDAGQSRLIVRCRAGQGAQSRMGWSDMQTEQFNKGSGRQTTNGFVYLGYPFGMGDNKQRKAIAPGARFTVEVSCHRPALPESERAPTSMWGLGHFGALGTRARRGFGAVVLTGWRLEDLAGGALRDADLEKLPLLHRASSASDWIDKAHRGIDALRGWFGTFESKGGGPHHPCFGPEADLVVWSKHKRDDWRGALLALGQELQGFRQRMQPDYDRVKDHVRLAAREGGRAVERVPDRATFGLPLTFRFGSLPRGRPVTFTPIGGERHGSLLFLRPVLAGGALLGLFLRLDGDVPGIDTPVGLRGRSLEPAARNAMDEFVREIKKKAGR
jgi:CRISPR-associated protein Cmr1